MRLPFCRRAVLVVVLSVLILLPLLNAQETDSGVVFKAETRSVLVDAVVTDKKGVPIRGLTQQDFRVFEDGKEQVLRSFAYETENGSSSPTSPRYLVLFFDNASMSPSDQQIARNAAASFVQANAGPNRLMAVVNYSGVLRVSVNFTSDAKRLDQAISGTQQSFVQSNPALASNDIGLARAAANFASRNVLSSLGQLAKGMTNVPGRKTLIFLSAGFPLTPELTTELTAAVDACNRANIAVYPIDVRGLTTPMRAPSHSLNRGEDLLNSAQAYIAISGIGHPRLVYAAYPAQRGGTGGGGTVAGGGGGGGRAGGGTGTGTPGTGGGGRTGTGGTGTAPPRSGPTAPTRGPGTTSGNPSSGPAMMPIIPRSLLIPNLSSPLDNQQVLFALAEGTGGFLIKNTNNLLSGLQKIGDDLNQYYLLSYTPSEVKEGQCHTLKVKVNRSGTEVRARSGYCDVKPQDLLAGKIEGRDLEAKASGAQSGSLQAVMQAPFFYTQPNIARVGLVMDIPAAAMRTTREYGKHLATVNVLGVVTRSDKSVVARFSDNVKLDFNNKKQLEESLKKPIHYEKQFEVASGQYTLTVVFASQGESFGKLETPLDIEPHDGKQFAISALALSDHLSKYDPGQVSLEEGLEDRVPLIIKGMEIVPQAHLHMKPGETSFMYVELYEPQIASAAPHRPIVAMDYTIIDRKTGEKKFSSGLFDVSNFVQSSNPVVRIGLKLRSDPSLPPGGYAVLVKGTDFQGKVTRERRADFDLD